MQTYPMVSTLEDWLHDRDYVGSGSKIPYAKEALELLKSDGDGSTGHEPDDGGMGQELYDES